MNAVLNKHEKGGRPFTEQVQHLNKFLLQKLKIGITSHMNFLIRSFNFNLRRSLTLKTKSLNNFSDFFGFFRIANFNIETFLRLCNVSIGIRLLYTWTWS